MTNPSNRVDYATGNLTELQQNYALRAWLTATLTQTVQGEAAIKYRLAELEDEAQRHRVLLDQVTPAIESLRQTIDSVDEEIRRQHREIDATTTVAARDDAETPPKQAARGRQGGARSGRRKESQSSGPRRKAEQKEEVEQKE